MAEKTMDVEIDTQAATEPLKELAAAMPSAPIAPAHGIAAIALTMAMKYHEINTVQDGALYQQYKIEGKNMVPLHLDMVFDTAIKIEAHLLGASERIAKLVCDAILVGVDEDDKATEQKTTATVD